MSTEKEITQEDRETAKAFAFSLRKIALYGTARVQAKDELARRHRPEYLSLVHSLRDDLLRSKKDQWERFYEDMSDDQVRSLLRARAFHLGKQRERRKWKKLQLEKSK